MIDVPRHDGHFLSVTRLLGLPNILDLDISIIQSISYENTVSTRNLMLRGRGSTSGEVRGNRYY